MAMRLPDFNTIYLSKELDIFGKSLLSEAKDRGFKVGCRYKFRDCDHMYTLKDSYHMCFECFILGDGTWNVTIDCLAIWRSDKGWCAKVVGDNRFKRLLRKTKRLYLKLKKG